MGALSFNAAGLIRALHALLLVDDASERKRFIVVLRAHIVNRQSLPCEPQKEKKWLWLRNGHGIKVTGDGGVPLPLAAVNK